MLALKLFGLKNKTPICTAPMARIYVTKAWKNVHPQNITTLINSSFLIFLIILHYMYNALYKLLKEFMQNCFDFFFIEKKDENKK